MKTFKKLLSILLIALIAFTAIVPGKVQAKGENLTLTVVAPDGIAEEVITNKEIQVYKLFDLTVKDGVYTYSWDGIKATEEFFKAQGEEGQYDTIIEATEYVRTLSGTALTTLAEDYYEFCKGRNDAVVYTSEAGESKTFTGLDKGFYLVYDVQNDDDTSARSVAILKNLESDLEVPLKIETVEVEKTVDKTTANVGDTVNFEVTSKVPDTTGYTTYTFVVKDTLSEGLTLDRNSVAVEIGGDTYTAWTLVATEYEEDGETVKVQGTDANHLVLSFTSADFLQLTAGDEIVVTYSAELNTTAATVVENSNEVIIEYSNDPTTDSTGETEEAKVYVYTYKVDFTKKNTSNQPLPGAKFVLKYTDKNNVTKYIKYVDGKVTYVDSLKDEDGEYVPTVFESDDTTGALPTISGLKALEEGEYYTLVEIVAPNEYSLPSFDGFEFTITQELDATTGRLKTATFEYTSDDNNVIAKGYMPEEPITIEGTEFTKTEESEEAPVISFLVDVLNAKGSALPTTGGIGTTIFTVVGIIVMLAAAVALVARNRKND